VKSVVVLGSTGSIGKSTLDVIRANSKRFRLCGISAKEDINGIEHQIKEFRPRFACLFNENKAEELRRKVKGLGVEVLGGLDGLRALAQCEEADLVVLAVVGGIGLLPLIDAIKAKKRIAIANKEVIVMAGQLIMRLAEEKNVKILPIDSEHVAIFQCLEGHKVEDVERIILTASGGPFLKIPKEALSKVKPEDATAHPRWKMGKKISVDSATLMNKGLEVIEASWLFGIPLERISILIHPESVVHSFIEFIDGSLLAQLSIPDMRIPITYALSYPERIKINLERLNLSRIGSLHFEEVSLEDFPCLRLALQAAKIGGTSTVVLSAANEVAISLFLEGKIPFPAIPHLIETTLTRHTPIPTPTIEEILYVDKWAREEIISLL
jgi:1-deoxy-D-xylulose-5-phosphate reductoisomerase